MSLAASGAPAVRTTASTCCYCGVGCGVLIESADGRITGVRGDPRHPANFGRLCSKGANLHRTATPEVNAQVRLLQPQMRPARGATPVAVTWDDALDLASRRLLAILERDGPDAIGFYVSGQFLTEDYYAFNKLAKGLLRTNNIDSNSRLCMSSAVAGYKRTLGSDAPPCCYEDIDHADTIFVAGANPAFAHPVLFRRMEDARRAHPRQRLVVVDPRRTATADAADLHLAIAPGTDVALFHGMLHVLAWDGMLDAQFIERHTSGFEALKQRVREFTPQAAARICGIAEADLVRAAHWFGHKDAARGAGRRAATLSLYCQGLNQSIAGTDKNAALINLHLATGQIGYAGAGPFSLTGQPNAMGGREVGAMATLASGHRDLDNADHQAQIARLWGVDAVAAGPGLAAVEMFEAAAAGTVKALWIACTNPAQSLPDQALVREALRRAEFVVVQEAFATPASNDYADLLLPASSWGEKEGTVTNSERRISRVRAAVAPPGQARADWRIAVDLGRRLEAALRPGEPSLFDFAGPDAIWQEHRASTVGRDLDIGALSYALLDEAGPQQWPFAAGSTAATPRLYADGHFPTDDGRARFADLAFRPSAELRSARYPFSLLTGRLRDQWHGMSRSGTTGAAFGHVPEPCMDLHAGDLQRLGLRDGDLARVVSARGQIIVPVQASPELAPTQAFLAMHWGGEFLGGATDDGQASTGVNALMSPRRCPSSRQPELKHAAVSIAPARLPWELLAMCWLPADRVLQVREALRATMRLLPFAASVPFGSERQGVLLRAAGTRELDGASLDALEHLLGLDTASTLRLVDASRGRRRVVRTERAGAHSVLSGFLLAGDTSSQGWMRDLLLQATPVEALRARLLRTGAAAPIALAPPSRQICACVGVTRAQIEADVARHGGSAQAALAGAQQRLRCGTQCGSCLPEVQRLIREAPRPAAQAAER